MAFEHGALFWRWWLHCIFVIFMRQIFGPLVKDEAQALLGQQLGGTWAIESVQRLDLGGLRVPGIKQLTAGEDEITSDTHRCCKAAMGYLELIFDPLQGLREIDLGVVRVEIDESKIRWLQTESASQGRDSFTFASYQSTAKRF